MPDIIITPNRGTTNNPKIDFTGITAGTIKLEVLPDGTVTWNGASGSLFSISDSLIGSLMSVNDISGIPLFEVFSDNRVIVGQFGARLGIGTISPSASAKLHIAGLNTAPPNIFLETTNSSANGGIFWRNSTSTITSGISSNYGISDASGNLEFLTGGTTTRMSIGSDGVIKISNTSDAISTNTGALQIQGGIYVAKGGLFNNISLTTALSVSSGGTGSNSVPSAGQILVGNAGGTAYAPVSMSGDITISSAGVTAIGASKVTNSMLVNSSITFGSTVQALGSTISAINGVSIGASTASTGNFTTVTAGTVVGGTGTAIGGGGLVVNGTTDNNDSQLIIKKPSQSSFGVLSWDGSIYLSTNVFYLNGSWVHSAPSGNNYSQLFTLLPGTGVNWYASNDASASWNVASNITLWNDSGIWKSLVQSTAAGNSYFTGGNVGVGTANPSTRLTVGLKIAEDNSYSYDTNALYAVHQTATSTTVLNDPKEILLLGRQGTSGQAHGAAASFQLSRYENAGTANTGSRTRLDLVLAHDSFMTSPTTVMTMRSDGNIGVGQPNPSYKLDVLGSLRVTGFQKFGYSEQRSFAIFFANGVANQAVDIRFPNTYLNGYIEITITSSYNNQNSVGKLTKLFSIGANINNSIWNTTTSRIVEAEGVVANNWTIGDFAWDATNSKYIIPIYHIVSTGNNLFIEIKYFGEAAVSYPLLPDTALSSVYTTTIPAAFSTRHYVYYNDRLGVGTTAPSTLFQVAPSSSGNFRLDTNGSGGHYYQTESNARLGIGRDLITSAGHVSFTMAGGNIASTGAAITMPAASKIALYTSNGASLVERLTADSSGNVGIGETTPSSRLHLKNTDANVELRMGANTTGGTEYDPVIRMVGSNNSTGEGFMIQYDNDVGDTYIDNVWSGGTNTNPAIRFRTKTAGTAINAMQILHSGDVLIQNSTASLSTSTGALVVSGGVGIAGSLYVTAIQGGTGTFTATSGTSGGVFIKAVSTASGNVQHWMDLQTSGGLTLVRLLRGNGASGYDGNGLSIDSYEGFRVNLNKLGGSGGNFVIDGGNLGVGATSPTNKLEVSGNALVSKLFIGSANASYDLYNNGTSYFNSTVTVAGVSNLSDLQFNGKLSFRPIGTNTVYYPNSYWGIMQPKGTILYYDEEFEYGSNGIQVYNNNGGTAVTITRKNSSFLDGHTQVPNSTGYVLEIKHDPATSLGASPNNGGWFFATSTGAGKTLLCTFKMKVPSGRNVNFHSNSTGTSSNAVWLTNNAGTGQYEDYAFIVNSGTASWSSTFFFAVDGSATLFYTYLASATVYELTNVNDKVVGGSLGIGVNSQLTNCRLSLSSGNTARFGISDGTVTSNMWTTSSTFYISTQTNHPIQFITNATNRMVITADGNVKIGADASTFYKFTVDGDIKSSNGAYFATDSGNLVAGTTTGSAKLHIEGATTDVGNGIRRNVILYDTTAAAAGVGGGISFGGMYDTYSGLFNFATIQGFKENSTLGNTSAGLRFSIGSTERMRISSTGNVGIGTNDPAYPRFHVSGPSTSIDLSSTNPSNVSLIISNSDTAYGTMFATNASGNGFIQQRRTNDATTYNLFIQPYGGNVGIGQASAGERLTVTGNISATGGLVANSAGDYSNFNGGLYLWSSPSSTTSTIMFKNWASIFGRANTALTEPNGYATYHLMDTAGRGWVWRYATSSTGGTNVASLRNDTGQMTLGTGYDWSSGYQAQLNISAGQGSATTYRDIDLHGSWAAGEGHAITATHASGATNIVGQMVFQHDNPGSRIRFGRLYHSGDSGVYPMQLVSIDTSSAYLTVSRDIYATGGTSGNFGNRIILGNTSTPQTLQDTNLRPTIYNYGAYPVITLDHTVTSNSAHGPTIQFAFNGLTTGGTTGRQIVIGAPGDGGYLDVGFSGGASGDNTNKNPHNGISGYSGITPLRIFSNGILVGSTGAYPSQITSTSYALDVRGTSFLNYGVTTASSLTYGATAGQIFRNENSELAIGLSNASPYPLWIQGRNSSSAARDIVLQSSGGNVGIGNSSPAYKLDVTGDIRSTTSAYFATSSGNVGIGAASASYKLDVTGDARITGSLAVGNTTPSGTAGEIRATNNITAYYSDERLKTKLGNIPNALSKVLSLNGFYYEANETAQKLGYEKKREIGVSAQEVNAILPEVVAPAPIDDKYLTVRYEKLIPLLIEAIKEQHVEIKNLKVELEETKNRLNL